MSHCQIYDHNLASIRIVEWYHEYMTIATAQAAPNIAFIKYWGNRDKALALTGSKAAELDFNEAEMAELEKSAVGVAEQTEKVK